METHALDFRLRGHAPEGHKRFPIRTFPLRAMPVFRHTLRWLTPLPAVLLLLAASPAAASPRHDGTRPQFEESFVGKLPKDQQAIMWKWVASAKRRNWFPNLMGDSGRVDLLERRNNNE
jgi:hypothetical protein